MSSAELSGVAFIRACINMTSTIEDLVDDQQITIERIVGVALEPAALGIDFQEPMDRLSLNAVALLIRLAARPVGAQSKSFTPLPVRIRRIELTIVVFPTPGPPVITRAFAISARRIAAL